MEVEKIWREGIKKIIEIRLKRRAGGNVRIVGCRGWKTDDYVLMIYYKRKHLHIFRFISLDRQV